MASQRTERRPGVAPNGVFVVALLALTGCLQDLKHGAVDLVMRSAHRPPRTRARLTKGDTTLKLFAGDFHCHVAPPDRPPHVVRGLDETIRLARAEGLDFVVLTPHVRAGSFDSEATRRAMLAAADALPDPDDGPLFLLGFEYTDFTYGHAGVAFGDLDRAFAAAPIGAEDPTAFLSAYLGSGGIAVINHPLLVPLSSPISVATWDLSWRPLFDPGPFPAEIRFLDAHAQGFEAFNLAIAELRDRFLLADRLSSIRAVLEVFDRRIRDEGRRLTPVGGSDTHGHHLRATTFVLARDRTPEAIAEGVRRGRTCIRSPEACELMVRPEGGPWHIVGDAAFGERFEIRAPPGATVLIDGAPVSGNRFVLPTRACAVLRAEIGRGYSAPIYLNCPFAADAEK